MNTYLQQKAKEWVETLEPLAYDGEGYTNPENGKMWIDSFLNWLREDRELNAHFQDFITAKNRSSKIAMIKLVRSMRDCTLKEAKNQVEKWGWIYPNMSMDWERAERELFG